MYELAIFSVYYNRSDKVHDSVGSVVEQIDESILLVLVDDGSTDSTFLELKKWERKNVVILRHNNIGFVASIRKAIASYESKYIAIHGSGDISLTNRFAKQKSILDSNDEVGVVGCHCINKDLVRKKEFKLNTFSGLVEDASEELCRKNFLTHGEVMFRRSVYDKVGGYRCCFRYSQDYDLWLRLSNICKFYIIPEVLYMRYINEDGVGGRIDKQVEQQWLASLARYLYKVGHNDKDIEPLTVSRKTRDKMLRLKLVKLYIKSLLIGDLRNLKLVEFFLSRECSGFDGFIIRCYLKLFYVVSIPLVLWKRK